MRSVCLSASLVLFCFNLHRTLLSAANSLHSQWTRELFTVRLERVYKYISCIPRHAMPRLVMSIISPSSFLTNGNLVVTT
uniref:Secreted protein n=1 Tax=Caenorhabditis japonica TaxID=281687 RepID=A0A8R1IIZ6_CAEJA